MRQVEKQGKVCQQMDVTIRSAKHTSRADFCVLSHAFTKHYYISSAFAFKNTRNNYLNFLARS